MCQDQSAPKPSAAFPPPQWCYTSNLIKIGQLASEIFKFESVKFSSLKGKFKMSDLIRPKIEPDQAFMPFRITSNFPDDLIKNERSSMETLFSHYKSTRNFLDAQGS